MPDLILRAKESIEAYLGLGDEQPIPDGVSVLEVAV
jgi:hypothetical protein